MCLRAKSPRRPPRRGRSSSRTRGRGPPVLGEASECRARCGGRPMRFGAVGDLVAHARAQREYLSDEAYKSLTNSAKNGTKIERPLTLHHWLFREFPQRVREEWRLLLLMNIAFWGVALVAGLIVWHQPDMAYHFMGAKEIEKIQEMYQSKIFKTGRGAESDFTMFGFYIWNNVSIDFRTFAGGIFAGIPALLAMGYNGLHMGVIAAVLIADSVTRNNFWPFVITHSSFEIIGMLLAGVAGMRLGLTLLHPHRLSRRHALYQASIRVFPILIGAAILTFIAAFFEAFFCANASIPANIKYIAGAICWTSLILFFAFAGRQRSA